MPSINLDLDYFTHPKTIRFTQLLGGRGESLPLRLFCYCGRYYKTTGEIKPTTDLELENAIGWTGPRGKCVEALVAAGFLEPIDGGYRCHDFIDRNRHIEAYHQRAKKARAAQLARITGDDARGPPATYPGLKPEPSPAPALQRSAAQSPLTPQGGAGDFASQSKIGRLWASWTTLRRRRFRPGEEAECIRFLQSLPDDQARERCLQDAIDSGLVQLRKPAPTKTVETAEEYKARRLRLVTVEKERSKGAGDEALSWEDMQRFCFSKKDRENGTTANGKENECTPPNC